MQKGYVPDNIYGGAIQTFWVEGPFERNFFGSVKYKGRKRYYVTAYRCERCGLIKFYAGPNQTTNK